VSNSQSVFYAHPRLYGMMMRVLYGRHFGARYAAIADLIPAACSVVDLCAGDCFLYSRYLAAKQVNYLGLDISDEMVAFARSRGIPARRFDVRTDRVPTADVIVMQASLYQFLPDAASVLRKLFAAAADRVILAEPVRNLSSSSNAVVAALGRRLTRPSGGGYTAERFDSSSFAELCRTLPSLERLTPIPGGREMVALFRCQRSSTDSARPGRTDEVPRSA
jgi:SAM-dependent methyltransferase